MPQCNPYSTTLKKKLRQRKRKGRPFTKKPELDWQYTKEVWKLCLQKK
jgi:hypothetical protein